MHCEIHEPIYVRARNLPSVFYRPLLTLADKTEPAFSRPVAKKTPTDANIRGEEVQVSEESDRPPNIGTQQFPSRAVTIPQRRVRLVNSPIFPTRPKIDHVRSEADAFLLHFDSGGDNLAPVRARNQEDFGEEVTRIAS